MKQFRASYYLIVVGLCLFAFSCGKLLKKEVGNEYVGEWKNVTKALSIGKDKKATYESNVINGSGASEHISGTAKARDNNLWIDKRKFRINVAPTLFLARPGFLRAYMVLDDDSLFRDVSDPNHCSNGVQDVDESAKDCGGADCGPCPSCNDGVKNQNETDIDCGGDCSACSCEDGKKNQSETGVDCGGSCEPCSNSACTTPLGQANNGYLATGTAKNLYTTAYVSGNDEVFVEFDFTGEPYIKAYNIVFYKKNFLTIPIGLTELYKVAYNDDNEINKCSVEFWLDTQTLQAVEGSKVYVTRLSEKQFNLKFCGLKNYVTASGSINGTFSINANFTIN